MPLLYGLGISLYDYSPFNEKNTFIGFANFTKLIHDPVFHKSFGNTMYFVLVMVVINLILTLSIAQIISSFRNNKFRSAFRVVFFMPCVAPLAASSFVWRFMYDRKYGIINNTLVALFDAVPQNWLGEASTVMPAIIAFSLWADIGYNIIIFCAGIDGIPNDFYEAAVIDGANAVARFFRITLPLLIRTTCFVVIMTLISYFQAFSQFEVMLPDHGGANDMGLVLPLHIYRSAFVDKDFGYASSIAIALFIIIMIFTAISQRLNRTDWGY
ncbi:MAG: sugar ABC transporter permease [Treponema sp.]|jgi:multiple sugar transport system permease protein/raffinose/stachyose/melibiose transport system permease protein|nr:sugar ABC transporter permease [Treponema sp.]